MDFHGSSTPPKLSLSKIPIKLKPTTVPFVVMATPPLNKSASVPFYWEEIPGKPRPDFLINPSLSSSPPPSPSLHDCNSNCPPRPVARCLELPPRLFNVISSSSPTTVLDGPCNNHYGNNSPNFLCHEEEVEQRRRRSFSSLPKGYFGNILIDDDYDRKDNKVISTSSSWRWPRSFKDTTGTGIMSSGGGISNPPPSKIRRDNHSSRRFFRIKRRRSSSSFFNFSSSHSRSNNFLASVYGSLKQVVSWKR